jgi:FtsH-binding integral membrane protein
MIATSILGVLICLVYPVTFLAGFLKIGAIIWFMMSPHEKRLLPGLTISFFSGMFIGPLIAAVLSIDASLVITAFMTTVAIFASFTLASFIAKRGTYIFLGGYLLSGLNVLIVTSIISLLTGWEFLMNFQLFFGLFIFCTYIIFDTQVMIEHAYSGESDPTTDACMHHPSPLLLSSPLLSSPSNTHNGYDMM